MDRLPTYVLVFSLHLNRDKLYKNIINILNDYLKGLPHILYTDYLLDSNNSYYIFPKSCIIDKSLNKIFDVLVNKLNIIIFRYATYVYRWGDDTELPTYILGCYNVGGEQRLPPYIKINHNVVEKLKSMQEDYYD